MGLPFQSGQRLCSQNHCSGRSRIQLSSVRLIHQRRARRLSARAATDGSSAGNARPRFARPAPAIPCGRIAERRRCWSVEEKLRILAQSVAPGRSRRSNWRCSSSLPRSAIDEICLVPEGGQLRVELRGELTGILALAADSRKPGGLSATGLAQQIKLVAGTRYHLYRTALLWHLGRPRRTSM